MGVVMTSILSLQRRVTWPGREFNKNASCGDRPLQSHSLRAAPLALYSLVWSCALVLENERGVMVVFLGSLPVLCAC